MDHLTDASNSPSGLCVPPQKGLTSQMASPHSPAKTLSSTQVTISIASTKISMYTLDLLFIETIVKFPDKTFKNVLIAMFPVHGPRHLLQQPENGHLVKFGDFKHGYLVKFGDFKHGHLVTFDNLKGWPSPHQHHPKNCPL